MSFCLSLTSFLLRVDTSQLRLNRPQLGCLGGVIPSFLFYVLFYVSLLYHLFRSNSSYILILEYQLLLKRLLTQKTTCLFPSPYFVRYIAITDLMKVCHLI